MPPDSPQLRVLHLYDQYLNIYADRGNIAVLRNRCRWRDIDCHVEGLGLEEQFEPGAFDLIYVGGGQDRDQRMIAERMAGRAGEAIRESVENRCALLAVCGGYQLLGHGYRDTSGTQQPGVGLFDLHTEAGESRLIGNVAIRSRLPKLHTRPPETTMIVGFENHAGRTRLAADAQPLGEVVHGYGNNGEDGTEGCVVEHAVGTYLHGPLLPRNPQLADWLIAAALEHRYGAEAPELARLPDELEMRAHEVAVGRAAAERH